MTTNNPRDQLQVNPCKPIIISEPPLTEPHSIFDTRQKALIVFLVSTAATFSGFASNIYFPALPTIARDLSVSVELVNLSVTSYLIFQGLAPSIWGPISDVKGRRIAYICTFLVFLGASVGLAQTKNYATLIILRCLQSTGSASTIAIGSGVIGDITTRDERGGFMGIFQAGLLVPVAVGPVIGGALAGSLRWRAIFWFLTVYCAIFLVFLILLLPETLRSIVANGSLIPSQPILSFPLSVYNKTTKIAWNPDSSSSSSPAVRKHIDITGPFRILISKQAAPIIIFLAVHYAVWQMSITAMATLFEERYHLSTTQLGLCYIANGAGSIIGTLITGKLLDMNYRRVKSKHCRTTATSSSSSSPEEQNATLEEGSASSPAQKFKINNENENDNDPTFPLEKARLRLTPIFSLLQSLSILLFGWTVQHSTSIPTAVPLISTFITGWTAVSTQSIVTTYLVDIFPHRSAAATASLNLARCLLAAGGTSVVNPLIDVLGVGWTFTLGIGVQVLSCSGVWVVGRWGGVWRDEMEGESKLRNLREEEEGQGK